ncbi:MAG: RHS repeat-associated core domain-containing protein, partial [Planctomycetaceae bacterium]|nr:RHS repeat-associated core domain-containing protein [Planctomycetaceae bacterium]
ATENYFDNAGNLVTKIQVPVDAKKLQPVGEKRVVKYAHNAIEQVTIAYNNFGERKTLNRFANGKEVVKTDYNWDLLGRITEIKHGKVNTFAYTWDNRNRLVKVETPTETVEYVYDYLNRLVKRKQDKNETVFIHDKYQVVLQLENNKPTHQYLWGTNQDELLCDNDNWTLGDHLNSVRDVVSIDGSVSHLEYNAFGKLLSENTDDVIFAYTGKMRDNVSDLQWNINRWYDANVGRWCSEDPIGFKGKDTNLFRYVKDTVTIYVDKLGLFEICPDKCTVLGNISEITIAESGVMSNTRGHPGALNADFKSFDNTVLIATLIDIASLGNAALLGAKAFTDEVVTQLAMGGITPDTDVIREKLNNLVKNMATSDMNSGIMIWINIQFKECQTVPCCFRYTRKNYVQRSEWYSCDLGDESKIENVPNNILPCLQKALRRAGNGEQGDKML